VGQLHIFGRESRVDGLVDLTSGTVDGFSDYWDPTYEYGYEHQIAGFSYRALVKGSDNLDNRLDWLQKAQEGYAPHGYDELAPRVL
jgi:hypothetical protein